MTGTPVQLDTLTTADIVPVARFGAEVAIPGAVLDRVSRGRAVVESLTRSQTPSYGISTGFGALATVRVPPDRRAALQRSLVASHAATSGRPVPTEVVRAMMLLRARTLATGHTGVRPAVLTGLVDLLNSGITPVVGEYGSLGCSGDLAPLAHAALLLCGAGLAQMPDGSVVEGSQALAAAGLDALELAEKEGLALVNGTDGMLGMLLLANHDLRGLLQDADITAAMSIEALLGRPEAFAADLLALRPHPGQARSGANLVSLLAGSAILAAMAASGGRIVQDAYSLRCAPQVAGAARDAADHASAVAEREFRSVIDNPVVLFDGRVVSNGNFHGAPLALSLDLLAIAVAQVASISERRTDRLLDPNRSNGLPPFLAHEVGVDSGYMIAQYTAAGIVASLKRLAAPASVDSIPSSAMQEDHVSMGWAAGLKLREALSGLTQVLAIEALVAARALDLRAPAQPAAGTRAALSAIRTRVGGPGPDRLVSAEIAAVAQLLGSGELRGAVAVEVGSLG